DQLAGGVGEHLGRGHEVEQGPRRGEPRRRHDDLVAPDVHELVGDLASPGDLGQLRGGLDRRQPSADAGAVLELDPGAGGAPAEEPVDDPGGLEGLRVGRVVDPGGGQQHRQVELGGGDDLFCEPAAQGAVDQEDGGDPHHHDGEGDDGGQRGNEPAAQPQRPHPAARYPNPRTVWISSGWEGSRPSLARRRWMATSTRRVSPTAGYPHTFSNRISRVNTRPGRRASSQRRRNSVGERSISSPPRVTRWAATSTLTSPTRSSSPTSARFARRSTERRRATRTGISNGFVM